MNVVKIDNKFIKYNEAYYYEHIGYIESDFLIENSTLNYLDSINGDSCLIAYYIVYLIVSGNDIFTIILHSYTIKGTRNDKFITDDILKSIIEYIENNKEAILNYSDGLICASDFILLLKSI